MKPLIRHIRATAILLALGLLGADLNDLRAQGAEAVTDAMRERSLVSMGAPARLDAVFAKAQRGEPITIAAIGGSITAGGERTKTPANRYIAQVAKWFEAKFPKSKITFMNAGIGSTNSGFGALRVERDVLSKNPDLVIVEFAVNDSFPGFKLDDSYEGVLRQILSSPKQPAAIELFFMHKDDASAQDEQSKLGTYYGLPMVSFRNAFFPEYKAGTLKWEDFYADVVHPNDQGHGFASELLRNFFDKALARFPSNGAALPQIKPLPAPLVSDAFQRCWLFRADDLKTLSNEGWTVEPGRSIQCSPAGGKLEYEATGDRLLLGVSIPKGAADKAFISVDGGERVSLSVRGPNRALVTGLTPGRHRVVVTVEPYTPAPDDKDPNVKISWGGSAGVPKGP